MLHPAVAQGETPVLSFGRGGVAVSLGSTAWFRAIAPAGLPLDLFSRQNDAEGISDDRRSAFLRCLARARTQGVRIFGVGHKGAGGVACAWMELANFSLHSLRMRRVHGGNEYLPTDLLGAIHKVRSASSADNAVGCCGSKKVVWPSSSCLALLRKHQVEYFQLEARP